MKFSKKPMKKVFFSEYIFHISENVYEPAEDTFLLAENLCVNENDFVLDMGTGCGILGILVAKKARRVIMADINPYAVCCAKMNAKLNGVERKIDMLQGDLFRPIKKGGDFEVILFNAPYLPSEREEQKTWIEKAWAGGHTGRVLIDRFLLEAPKHLKMDGRILLVQSTLSEVDKTMQTFEGAGLQANVIAEKKVAFEGISVIEAKRYERGTRHNCK